MHPSTYINTLSNINKTNNDWLTHVQCWRMHTPFDHYWFYLYLIYQHMFNVEGVLQHWTCVTTCVHPSTLNKTNNAWTNGACILQHWTCVTIVWCALVVWFVCYVFMISMNISIITHQPSTTKLCKKNNMVWPYQTLVWYSCEWYGESPWRFS